MTDRDPRQPSEPRPEVIAQLLDQLTSRTHQLRAVEKERDELARRLTGRRAVRWRVAVSMIRRKLRGAFRKVIPPRRSGFLDIADCHTISGWAWSVKKPQERLSIEILDGATPLTTVVADRYRPDLEANGVGDGAHGFRIPAPSSLRDGSVHTIWARIAGTRFTLEGTPKRVICSRETDDILIGARSVSPVSRRWGVERGTPLDRRYIEGFLARHARDIRGRVLEIGNNVYTTMFGGEQVSSSDVLNVLEGDPDTTIVADLADGQDLPSDAFDAAIVTETLQLIYDVPAAIRTLHRILKPGGVVLVTVPGITPMGDVEWGNSWYWSFSALSIRTLFEESFRSEDVSVDSYGNVLAAASFLYGLTAEDLTSQELDVRDPAFPVTLAVRAVKERGIEGPRSKRMTGAAATTRPAAVLLYHRVAEVTVDPWGNSVDPGRFAEHLDALSDAADVVPLSDIEDSGDRRGKRPTVALTFDDGYEDNLLAHEALRRHDQPATFFVVSGNLGREFWWDQLVRLLLHPGVLKPSLHLSVGGRSFVWELEDSVTYSLDDLTRDAGWRVIDGADPTPRHSVLRSVHALLMALPETEQTAAMADIREWVVSLDEAHGPARALSEQELRALASDPRVEIGAHTASHPALSSLPAKERRHEIRASKDDLENLLDRPVRQFAYPFGICDAHTAAMVRAAGFDRAWVIEGTAGSHDDPMRLRRLFVRDWSGAELVRQLVRWTAG